MYKRGNSQFPQQFTGGGNKAASSVNLVLQTADSLANIIGHVPGASKCNDFKAKRDTYAVY